MDITHGIERLRRAPGRARAAQHAALHAGGRARGGRGPAGGHRAARGRAAHRRRPHPGRARTTACSASPGSAAAGWRSPWTSPARRTGSSRCRPPSTGATSSRRSPRTSPRGAELADAGDPLDPDSLERVELPEPRDEDGAVVAHALVIDRFGNVGLNVDHDRLAGTGHHARRARGGRGRRRALRRHLRADVRRREPGRADRLRGRLPHARARDQPRRRGRHARHRRRTPRCGCGRDDRHAAGPPPADRLDQRARPGAGRGGRAARNARDRRRADGRPRPPGPRVDRAARLGGADVAGAARPRRAPRAAAAGGGGGGVRGAVGSDPRRRSSGRTTSGSTAARWPASWSRGGRRRAGRCSGSG